MALTNNTKYRRIELTLTKKVNGSLQTAQGFPITVSILLAFTDPATSTVYPLLTQSEFVQLTDGAYNARLNAFYNYMENTYSFFLRTVVGNLSSGTDAVVCPLDNTPAPTLPTVVEISFTLLALSYGVTASALTWYISLTKPSTLDLNYSFQINIKNSAGAVLRTELANGIIPSGIIGYNGYLVDGDYLHLYELENPSYTGITYEVVPGTIQLFL